MNVINIHRDKASPCFLCMYVCILIFSMHTYIYIVNSINLQQSFQNNCENNILLRLYVYFMLCAGYFCSAYFPPREARTCTKGKKQSQSPNLSPKL